MAPRSKPARFQVPPELADDMREALAEAERGEGEALTAEELKRWAETGEWPERFDRKPA